MRCFGDGDPLYESYHDTEWGRPVAQENALFERLALEGFQSGLSWITILRRRDGFRRAFHDFVPERVGGMQADDVERLLADATIIRNRAKIEATIANARALTTLHGEGATLGQILWSYARLDDDAPVDFSHLPAHTDGSKALSKKLKKLGFRFVGPTTAYATLQATGIVNDHLAGCSVRGEVEDERRAFLRSRLHG